MYLNKVFIFGNLTRDPELRSLPSGNAVVNFSLATNRVWKDKDGNKQENTEFHNIVIFGRQAETAAQYLKKGSSLLVEGRLQTRSWDDNAGAKRYRTEIIVDRFQFGPRAGGSGGVDGGFSAPSAPDKSGQQQPPRENLETIEYPEEESKPEDIPF